MPKNIVICFDGTWNQRETQTTALCKISQMIDRENSVSIYLAGVGVAGRQISNWLDGVTGRGVFRHVRDAYTFVSDNYLNGDKIMIFGFSRGAYAARHLAGMITRLGFGLPMEKTWEAYATLVMSGEKYQIQQQVQFLGLFDCVPGNQTYGLRKRNRLFNDPLLEPGIVHFAHALSRDDRRWSFAPLIFSPNGQARFEQVWLPGYHFDLGGDSNPPLNGFSLWWMLREAYGAGLSLANIKCPKEAKDGWHHGRLGVSLGFLPAIDSEAAGRPSDYLTTRVGLRCHRAQLAGADRVGPIPRLEDLDECPRGCGEELFDYFGTAEGIRRLANLKVKLANPAS